MVKIVITTCALFLINIIPAYAASPGTSIFGFLKLNPAARTAALGNINNVISSQTTLFNPAALAWIGNKEVSAHHLLYFSGISYSMLSYIHPINKNVALGTSLGYLNFGSLVRTEYVDPSININQYEEKGTFGANGAIVIAGYGHKISRYFSYGINIKAMQETLDQKSYSGAAASISGLYCHKLAQNPGYGYSFNKQRNYGWQLSFGLFNLGPQSNGFDMPMGGYFGSGMWLSPFTYLSGELVGYNDNTSEIRTGIEVAASNTLFFRLGYYHPLNTDPLRGGINLTGGAGLSVGPITLDYAWVPYGDLGQTHRISISLR